jgi:hypothetical protein
VFKDFSYTLGMLLAIESAGEPAHTTHLKRGQGGLGSFNVMGER